MSNFFEGINTNNTSFEIGGGFELLPKDTRVVATCEQAVTKSYEGRWSINIKWRVNLPSQFANRVIFQTLKVWDDDSSKAQKAKAMLAAIATNAGGRLFQSMQQRNENDPSDESLQTLMNAPMVLLIDVWEIEGKSGNWVKAVSAYNPTAQRPAPVVQMQQPAPSYAQPTIDDDMPF